MNQKTYFAREAEEAYRLHGYVCLVCGWKANQLAHRIPQRAHFVSYYGWRVIHSRYNRLPVCSLACNAKLQCNAASDLEVEQIAKEIMRKIAEEKSNAY